MSHERELFRQMDAPEGQTLVATDDESLLCRYLQHRQQHGFAGLIASAHDTRTLTGLIVFARDPVPAADLARVQGHCLWLLEEILAGRQPWPVAGQVTPLELHKLDGARHDRS